MFSVICALSGDSIRGWSGATWKKEEDLHPKPAPTEPPVIRPVETVEKPIPVKK